MQHSAVVDVWWVSVEVRFLLGNLSCSCVTQSQVAVLNGWGCVLEALKDGEEEER